MLYPFKCKQYNNNKIETLFFLYLEIVVFIIIAKLTFILLYTTTKNDSTNIISKNRVTLVSNFSRAFILQCK